MKILITGIAGLIGSNFGQYMIAQGHNVAGIDNLFGGYKEFIPEKSKFVLLDLARESFFVNHFFGNFKPDVVYHFAAYAAEGLSPFIRRFNYTNNVLSSMTVINNCVNHGAKLVYTSSMAVYGQGEPPFYEHTAPSPIDPYGIAKYTVEQDIRQAGEQFGLKYSIVRPHNVLGINQNIWDKYRNVIGIWIRRALRNESIIVYGDGEQRRAFSDIKYYLKPLEILATDYDGETFNIGADKDYSLNEVAHIVQKIAAEFGNNTVIEYKEARHEAKYAYCDHTKAKQLLKFEDNTDLECLIREMYQWAKAQPDREVKKMEYEITKDIYSFWK